MKPEEIAKLYDNVTAPLSLFATLVCGIAMVTSYIYPQQRKFPNVVILWACVNDFIGALKIAMTFLPGPVNEYFTKHTSDPAICTFSLYYQWVTQQSASMIGLLLAFTLFITIVQKVDLHESGKKYYYWYIAVFWIPTLLIPLYCLSERQHIINPGYCTLSQASTIILRVGTWYFCLLLQIIFMVPVFHVVYTVNRSVRSSRLTFSDATFWLCARFAGAQCNQIVVWFPGTIWNLNTLLGKPNGAAITVISAITPGTLCVNGFIVLAGNKPLWASLSRYYDEFRIRFCAVRSRTHLPNYSIDESQT